VLVATEGAHGIQTRQVQPNHYHLTHHDRPEPHCHRPCHLSWQTRHSGTRLPVTVVVGSLAGGMTFEDVQREYDVTADDIRAALRFVGELAEQESFHPLP
jgi:uncharacterized protein (DUF433 family)